MTVFHKPIFLLALLLFLPCMLQAQGFNSPNEIADAFRKAMLEEDTSFLAPAFVTQEYAMQTEKNRFRGQLDHAEYGLDLDSILSSPGFEGNVNKFHLHAIENYVSTFDWLLERSLEGKLNWKKDNRSFVLWSPKPVHGFAREGSLLLFYKLRGVEVMPFRIDFVETEGKRYFASRIYSYNWSRASRAVDGYIQSRNQDADYRVAAFGSFRTMADQPVKEHYFTQAYRLNGTIHETTFVLNETFQVMRAEDVGEMDAFNRHAPAFPDITWLNCRRLSPEKYRPKTTAADDRRKAYLSRMVQGNNILAIAQQYAADGDTVNAEGSAATALDFFQEAIPYAATFPEAYYKGGLALNVLGVTKQGCRYLQKAFTLGMKKSELDSAMNGCDTMFAPPGPEIEIEPEAGDTLEIEDVPDAVEAPAEPASTDEPAEAAPAAPVPAVATDSSATHEPTDSIEVDTLLLAPHLQQDTLNVTPTAPADSVGTDSMPPPAVPNYPLDLTGDTIILDSATAPAVIWTNGVVPADTLPLPADTLAPEQP